MKPRERLNQILIDCSLEEFLTKYEYLTVKDRPGGNTTWTKLRTAYANGNFVPVLERYDPVAYNSAINDLNQQKQ